jgi:hypothetical protein
VNSMAIELPELEIYDEYGVNIALNGTAIASSVHQPGFSIPKKAIDGELNRNYWSGIYNSDTWSERNWWEVDLGSDKNVTLIHIYNRNDCCSSRFDETSIYLLDGNRMVLRTLLGGDSSIMTFDFRQRSDMGMFHQNSRFRLFVVPSVSLARAMTICHQPNSTVGIKNISECGLAEIRSSAEQETARNMTGPNLRTVIGAVRNSTTNVWMWRSGTPLSTDNIGFPGMYTNWGSVTNARRDSTFAVIAPGSGLWAGVESTNALIDGVLCQTAAYGATITIPPRQQGETQVPPTQGSPIENVRYVAVVRRQSIAGAKPIQLAEVMVLNSSGFNLALGKPATQSSTWSGAQASRAVDGNVSQDWNMNSIAHTTVESRAWWEVDLGYPTSPIAIVMIYGRSDAKYKGMPETLEGASLLLLSPQRRVLRKLMLSKGAIQSYNFRRNPKLGDVTNRFVLYFQPQRRLSDARMVCGCSSRNCETLAELHTSADNSLAFAYLTKGVTDVYLGAGPVMSRTSVVSDWSWLRSKVTFSKNGTCLADRYCNLASTFAPNGGNALVLDGTNGTWQVLDGSTTATDGFLCDGDNLTVSTTESRSSTDNARGTRSSARLAAGGSISGTLTLSSGMIKPPPQPPTPAKKNLTTHLEPSRTLTRIPFNSSANVPLKSPSSQVTVLSSITQSDTVAVIIASAGAASTAVSGLVSPGAATQNNRLGALTNVLNCLYTEADSDPSPFDQPFQVNFGSGIFATYVGSTTLTVMLFLVFPFLVLTVGWCLGRRHSSSKTIRTLQGRLFSTLFFTSLGYFGPTVIRGVVLVASHSRTALNVAIMALSAGFVCVIWFGAWYVVVSRLPISAHLDGTESRVRHGEFERDDCEEAARWSNTKPGSFFVETFGPLFDGAKDTSFLVRIYFVEELSVTIGLQLIDGVRPLTGSCRPLAIAMLVVCLLHLLYAVAVRPHNSKLESLLFVLGAAFLAAVAVNAVMLTSGVDNPTSQQSLAILSLINTIFFFVQAGILGAEALARQHKRKLRQQWTNLRKGGKLDSPLLSVPDALVDLNSATALKSPVAIPLSLEEESQDPIGPPERKSFPQLQNHPSTSVISPVESVTDTEQKAVSQSPRKTFEPSNVATNPLTKPTPAT